MDLNRVANKVGLYLSMACFVYGILILLILRSFTATIVPGTDGRETPELASIAIAVVAMVLLIAVVPGWLSKIGLNLQKRLRKRGSWVGNSSCSSCR